MNRKWKKAYPEMPESFHTALLEALSPDEAAVSVGRTAGIGRKAVLVAGIAAAAILAAAGIYKGLETFYPSGFLSESAKEGTEYGVISEMHESQHRADASPDIIQSDLAVFPETEAILRVAEAKCDGIELFAVLEKTAAAKEYDISLGRLYINDEVNEEIPVCTDMSENTFAFRADISKKPSGNSFQATVVVNVYGHDGTRYRDQELSFQVSGGRGVERRLAGQQTFVHDECTVTVLSAAASANCLRLELETEVSASLAETDGIHFAVLSESGEELHVLDGTRIPTEKGFADVLIVSGYTEIPKRICLACRIGPKEEVYTIVPVHYEDWINLD